MKRRVGSNRFPDPEPTSRHKKRRTTQATDDPVAGSANSSEPTASTDPSIVVSPSDCVGGTTIAGVGDGDVMDQLKIKISLASHQNGAWAREEGDTRLPLTTLSLDAVKEPILVLNYPDVTKKAFPQFYRLCRRPFEMGHIPLEDWSLEQIDSAISELAELRGSLGKFRLSVQRELGKMFLWNDNHPGRPSLVCIQDQLFKDSDSYSSLPMVEISGDSTTQLLNGRKWRTDITALSAGDSSPQSQDDGIKRSQSLNALSSSGMSTRSMEWGDIRDFMQRGNGVGGGGDDVKTDGSISEVKMEHGIDAEGVSSGMHMVKISGDISRSRSTNDISSLESEAIRPSPLGDSNNNKKASGRRGRPKKNREDAFVLASETALQGMPKKYSGELHKFWKKLKPYVRHLTEDDVRSLLPIPVEDQDEELWDIPPLGKHFSIQWNEKDRVTLGSLEDQLGVSTVSSSSSSSKSSRGGGGNGGAKSWNAGSEGAGSDEWGSDGGKDKKAGRKSSLWNSRQPSTLPGGLPLPPPAPVACQDFTARLLSALMEERVSTDNPVGAGGGAVAPSVDLEGGGGASGSIIDAELPYPPPNGVHGNGTLFSGSSGLTGRLSAATESKGKHSKKPPFVHQSSVPITSDPVRNYSGTVQQSLNDRILAELKVVGLISDEEDEDYLDAHEDDEICAELRLLQSRLKEQIAINNERKVELASLAVRAMQDRGMEAHKGVNDEDLINMYERWVASTKKRRKGT